jgi:hypothetical protein
MMLSGVSAEAGDGVKVLIDPSSQQQSVVTMDISNSLMFDAEGYLKAIYDHEEWYGGPSLWTA